MILLIKISMHGSFERTNLSSSCVTVVLYSVMVVRLNRVTSLEIVFFVSFCFGKSSFPFIIIRLIPSPRLTWHIYLDMASSFFDLYLRICELRKCHCTRTVCPTLLTPFGSDSSFLLVAETFAIVARCIPFPTDLI